MVEIKAWLGLILAFCATFSWRFLGVVLADRISSTGLLMSWINAVAYSMVAGVLMLVLVNPTGILITASLSARLLGLFAGVFVICLSRKIPLSIAIGIGIGVFVVIARLESN